MRSASRCSMSEGADGRGEQKLSHLDESGKASMVDVGGKVETERLAVARGTVTMREETLRLIEESGMEKGDVLGVARVAGIMAAKETARLIPLWPPPAARPGGRRVRVGPGAERGRDYGDGQDDGQDGCGDGGDDGGVGRRAGDLRHVQERRPRDAHRGYQAGAQDGRQE